jgi:hypothetical protein
MGEKAAAVQAAMDAGDVAGIAEALADKHTRGLIQRNADELSLIMANAKEAAQRVYLQAVRSTLARCPSLDYFLDAMGSRFFVLRSGEIVHNDDALPATAREFVEKVADPYFEAFGSLGWKIYRDHIVYDW